MTRRDADELAERLRALVAHRVSAPTRARHLAAIEAELVHLPGSATAGGTGDALAARWRARRWLAGLAAATTVLTPGVAVAAQGAVPGDALYSVKRATEHVHVLIAPDVVARHRIAELATLLDRDSPSTTLEQAAAAARDAVAALPDDHRLRGELAVLLARVTDRGPHGTSDTAPASPADTDVTTAGEELGDDPGDRHPHDHDRDADDADDADEINDAGDADDTVETDGADGAEGADGREGDDLAPEATEDDEEHQTPNETGRPNDEGDHQGDQPDGTGTIPTGDDASGHEDDD